MSANLCIDVCSLSISIINILVLVEAQRATLDAVMIGMVTHILL